MSREDRGERRGFVRWKDGDKITQCAFSSDDVTARLIYTYTFFFLVSFLFLHCAGGRKGRLAAGLERQHITPLTHILPLSRFANRTSNHPYVHGEPNRLHQKWRSMKEKEHCQ